MSKAAIANITWEYLHRTFVTEVTDGRIIVGKLICTDSEANIILSNCEEYVNYEAFDNHRLNRCLNLCTIEKGLVKKLLMKID